VPSENIQIKLVSLVSDQKRVSFSCPSLTDVIKVEWEFSRNGAVEPGLEESGEAISVLLTSRVMAAEASHPTVDNFPTICVFDGEFTEEEKSQVTVAQRGNKRRA